MRRALSLAAPVRKKKLPLQKSSKELALGGKHEWLRMPFLLAKSLNGFAITFRLALLGWCLDERYFLATQYATECNALRPEIAQTRGHE